MVRKQYVLMSNEELGELEHFGVKGMKWGVRKDRLRKAGSNFISRHRERKEIAKIAKSIRKRITWDGKDYNVKSYNKKVKAIQAELKKTQEYKEYKRTKRLFNAADKAYWGRDDYEEKMEPFDLVYTEAYKALRQRNSSITTSQKQSLKKAMLSDLGLEPSNKNMKALDNWRLDGYFDSVIIDDD